MATKMTLSRTRRKTLGAATALAAVCTAVGTFAPGVASAQTPPRVLMKTSMGDITIELYPEKAPITVANFLSYVKDGHYNNTIFHRVILNFMIQGGGFTRDLKQKPTKKAIELEAQNGLRNDEGWVAMARTSNPNSATSQFFINVVDNPNLNFPAPDGYGYAVFGKVVKGIEIVTKIRNAQTIAVGLMRDVPADPIIIDSITLQK
jgi:peptidyl-prolyl cis-trans isomerase A (cyclophilin A)